uniref:AlNc14C18G1929 protein n=1 Tax=Albugo laibachii Nc14 TaxID=890382 RepID=F0W4V9_9STRA|nr:AlNc14C18G1929 [Albugo laibachii Nc14]CCA25108.1 AlNc14C275G10035 [Albugo laibachii Nc14]|eukprot:CCA25108.1 AlNc14C275G10035 [Albugo laibachii Nc14]
MPPLRSRAIFSNQKLQEEIGICAVHLTWLQGMCFRNRIPANWYSQDHLLFPTKQDHLTVFRSLLQSTLRSFYLESVDNLTKHGRRAVFSNNSRGHALSKPKPGATLLVNNT